jgi:hypothetical protein
MSYLNWKDVVMITICVFGGVIAAHIAADFHMWVSGLIGICRG